MQGWGWGCRAEWIVELIVVIGCFGVHFGFFGKKEKEANILEEIKKKTKRGNDLLFRFKRKRRRSLHFLTELLFFCRRGLEFWFLVDGKRAFLLQVVN